MTTGVRSGAPVHVKPPAAWRMMLGLAAAHFALWYASAQIAYGFDLDQLPSRSGLAAAAAAFVRVLQWPHDLVVRALPGGWLQQIPQAAALLVLLNSLAWGAALMIAWQTGRKVKPSACGDDRL